MTITPPTSIPLLQRVETATGGIGLIAIDVFGESWQLRVALAPDYLDAPFCCSDREERRGRGAGCDGDGASVAFGTVALRALVAYSPLYESDLELDLDSSGLVARRWDGGTAGSGFAVSHAFDAPELPARMIVRRPATDAGPPLVEVDVGPRRFGISGSSRP